MLLEEKLKSLPEDAPERTLLAEAIKRIAQRRLLRYVPYPFQQKFHNLGAENSQRLLMAANGVGKTIVGAAETAMHLTGKYPDWWRGRRFDKHVLVWVGSISNQTQRDYTQPALFGENLGDSFGTGFIPGESIVGRPRIRQAGIGDVVDIANVMHVSGKTSQIVMKCHPAGQRIMMAEGHWKPIEEVQVGEWLACADGIKRRTTQKHLYENVPVLRVVTNCGNISGTPNHPVFTQRGKLRMDELLIGDILEVACPEIAGEHRPDWEVRLTAFLIGDGCFRGKTPKFTCANPVLLAEIKAALPDDLRLVYISRYDYKISSTTINHNRLTDSLRLSGLWGHKSDTKRIPDWVFKLPLVQRIDFLRWIWSADGTMQRNAATYCTCQAPLANDMRLLLLSVGIPSRTRVHGDRHYQVYVSRDARANFQKIGKIGVDCEAGVPKQSDWQWGAITAIESEPSQDVYGLGVPDVNELIVEGFRVGNTYEQGWRMWQGAAPDIVWMDEQPDENTKDEKPIFSEVVTRIFRSSGIMYATLTPLLGETNMIRHFMQSTDTKGVAWVGATWDDAPHLNEAEKVRAKATYGDHEVEVRTQGIPMMGEGRVFSTSEADFKIPPKKIPDHWARIIGIDFGIDHPCAVAECAWDRDEDVFYVVRTWSQKGADVPTHAMRIRGSEPWVPVAWPHDGGSREKSNGKRLKDIYVESQVKMLSMSARYKNETGGGQPVEPIIIEMQNRLRDGELRVFNNCTDFFDEYRSYHRKDGKVVAIRDDVIKAVMYALMMRRYAMPKSLSKRAPKPSAYTRPLL